MYLAQERLAGGKIIWVIFPPTPSHACPGCWWQGRQGGSCQEQWRGELWELVLPQGVALGTRLSSVSY